MFTRIQKLLKAYLILIGIITHIGAVGALYFGLKHYQISPSQALVRVGEKLNIQSPLYYKFISPKQLYADLPIEGTITSQFPRILLPELRNWDGQSISPFFKQRMASYTNEAILETDSCKSNDIFGKISCWITTGNPKIAESALDQLSLMPRITPSAVGSYGNGLHIALAYDLLAKHPNIDSNKQLALIDTLVAQLKDYLVLLDGDSASLWHGRQTLASQAWLCALMLDTANPQHRPLISRAQHHFHDAINAMALTEAWPSGYNYWIQSRAYSFVMAAIAHLNSVKNSPMNEKILQVLKRIGLWTIYATRPDNRIEDYGDTGSRVDLKDETRRVIDLIAQATNDPVFATYSRHLEKLHGRESYFRGYRWSFPLFNNPEIPLLSGVDTLTLAGMENYLPNSDVFGKDAYNLAFIHTGWDKNASFISFRAGNTYSHHGHYDAGHFTFYKGAPLIVNSSRYEGFFDDNRLYYSIRSIAKNTLILQQAGEIVSQKLFKQNVADGGQRIIMPTGSAVTSVGNWNQNKHKNRHYEGGQINYFDHQPKLWTYIQSNLTGAYNSTSFTNSGNAPKAKRVERSLLYLDQYDTLVISDHVITTSADIKVKSILHSVKRPEICCNEEKVITGTKTNGISHSHNRQFSISNKQQQMNIKIASKQIPLLKILGGHNYRHYVEKDGDDDHYDGSSFNDNGAQRPWYDDANWRVEIQSEANGQQHSLLSSLSAGNAEIETIDQYGFLFDHKTLVLDANTVDNNLVLPGQFADIIIMNCSNIKPLLYINISGEKLSAECHKGLAHLQKNSFSHFATSL